MTRAPYKHSLALKRGRCSLLLSFITSRARALPGSLVGQWMNLRFQRVTIIQRKGQYSFFLLVDLCCKTHSTVRGKSRVLHPPRTIIVNWWRVSNTLVILGLGAAKAILAFQGQSIALNFFDCILGVVWAIAYVSNTHTLYCYCIYPSSPAFIQCLLGFCF